MRNLSKGEALVEAAGRSLGRTLEIKQLDVCNEDSIKACVDSLPERRVDILSMFSMGRKNESSATAAFNEYSFCVYAYLSNT